MYHLNNVLCIESLRVFQNSKNTEYWFSNWIILKNDLYGYYHDFQRRSKNLLWKPLHLKVKHISVARIFMQQRTVVHKVGYKGDIKVLTPIVVYLCQASNSNMEHKAKNTLAHWQFRILKRTCMEFLYRHETNNCSKTRKDTAARFERGAYLMEPKNLARKWLQKWQ